MDTQSPSETEHNLDNKVLELIKNTIAGELKEQGIELSENYLAQLGNFWSAVQTLFGDDKTKREEIAKNYPGLARFQTLDQFKEFYGNQVISKITKLAEEGKLENRTKKQLIHISKRLKEDGNTYNFLIPFTEKERRDKSHNIAHGGIHTDVTFVMPDGQTVTSRHKHFAFQKEHELEQTFLNVLSRLGHKVITPESPSQQLLILSTPLYKSDMRYLMKKQDGKYMHSEEERLKRANEATDILIPAVIDLTSYKQGNLKVPSDVDADLKRIFTHSEVFEENRIRFGLHEQGLVEKFFGEAAKTANTTLDPEDKHLTHLIDKYNKLVYSKIDKFQKFMVHGDVFAGNMLEDFDGSMALTDFTPFEAPITFDLYLAFEFLGLEQKARDEALKNAASQMWKAAKKNGLDIKATTEASYLARLKHEYQWMSIHRNLTVAGLFTRLKRLDPEAKLPDPSQYYSRTLKAIDELGKDDPEFIELGSLFRHYISKFKKADGTPVLSEIPVDEVDLSFLHENPQASLTEEAVNAVADALGTAPKLKQTADAKRTLEEAPRKSKHGVPAGHYDGPGAFDQEYMKRNDELKKQVQAYIDTLKGEDKIPEGCFDDTEMFARKCVNFFKEAIKGKIEDEGAAYVCKVPVVKKEYLQIMKKVGVDETTINEMDKTLGLDNLVIVKFDKVHGDLEYSIRGKELHIINHRANKRYKVNLAEENSEIKEYNDQTAQFTDRRTVWDTQKLLETDYGKKITIETLEDRILFKKKGILGSKVVDEILFDTAPRELQLLKYLNDNYERHGHALLEGKEIKVNGQKIDFQDQKVVVLDYKNRIVEGEHISVFKDQSTKGPKTDEERLFRPAKTPFALKGEDGSTIVYKEKDGKSELTTLEAEKIQYWNGIRKTVQKAATAGMTATVGLSLLYQYPWYVGAGAVAAAGLTHMLAEPGDKK